MTEDTGRTAPITAPVSTPATATPLLEKPRFKWTPRLVIWTILLIAALIFVLQNFDETKINVLFWDYQPPLALIVGIFFLVGYLLGWLRPHFRSHRKS